MQMQFALMWTTMLGRNWFVPPQKQHEQQQSGPERFVGGLMGVSAEVMLDRVHNRATVSLAGVPVGGRVSGKAEFGVRGEEEIVVYEPLKSVLSRRLVKIVCARHDEATNRVFVTVKLPFVLGRHTIVLHRAHDVCADA